MTIWCVEIESIPPSWRQRPSDNPCMGSEYEWDTNQLGPPPPEDWVWDASLGRHRARTAEEILSDEKDAKIIDVKAWVASINNRAYPGLGASDQFDDFISDLRSAIRGTINAFAVEEGLTARVSGAEIKLAFSAIAEFDMIVKAKEAKGLMVDEINALTELADVTAYVVNDEKAGTLHAAAYPTASPTLANLLGSFPPL